MDIVEVESLEVTHCDEASEVGECRLFILVEDLVVWLDEVIGRPSSTTENPSNFWWHITIYIVMCHQKFEGFSIVDDGLPIPSSSQTVRPHPRPHRNE